MHRAICVTWDKHVYSTSCAGCIFEAGSRSAVKIVKFCHNYCTWSEIIIGG